MFGYYVRPRDRRLKLRTLASEEEGEAVHVPKLEGYRTFFAPEILHEVDF